MAMFIVWPEKFAGRGAYLLGNTILSEPPLSVAFKYLPLWPV